MEVSKFLKKVYLFILSHSFTEYQPLHDMSVCRFWEDGWKDRYYTNKFSVSEGDEGYDDFRKKVVRVMTDLTD